MKKIFVALAVLQFFIPAAFAKSKVGHPAPAGKPATRETQEELPVASVDEETRLTGSWGGKRRKLSDSGLDLGVIYKGEVNQVFRGAKKKTVYLDNIDLRAGIDLEKMLHWKGATMFIYGLGNHGKNPTENVGDSQGSSNIETKASGLKLYEAWFQQMFYDDRASILVGLHDLNSEFYVTDSSGLFLNSTFGVGKELAQTGVNGPSIFSTTSPAVRLRVEPSKSFYLQTAAFNAQAGTVSQPSGTHIRTNPGQGLLMITEAAYLAGKTPEGGLYGKYGMGMWNYTRTFAHLTDTVGGTAVQSTSHGFYLLGEQQIAAPLTAFTRYGVASTKTNQFGSSLGAGLVYTGLLPKRPKDRLGFAIARARNGDEYMSQQLNAGSGVARAETAYEFSYRIEVRGGVAVQPDFQYIARPGAVAGARSAQVGALRFELNF